MEKGDRVWRHVNWDGSYVYLEPQHDLDIPVATLSQAKLDSELAVPVLSTSAVDDVDMLAPMDGVSYADVDVVTSTPAPVSQIGIRRGQPGYVPDDEPLPATQPWSPANQAQPMDAYYVADDGHISLSDDEPAPPSSKGRKLGNGDFHPPSDKEVAPAPVDKVHKEVDPGTAKWQAAMQAKVDAELKQKKDFEKFFKTPPAKQRKVPGYTKEQRRDKKAALKHCANTTVSDDQKKLVKRLFIDDEADEVTDESSSGLSGDDGFISD